MFGLFTGVGSGAAGLMGGLTTHGGGGAPSQAQPAPPDFDPRVFAQQRPDFLNAYNRLGDKDKAYIANQGYGAGFDEFLRYHSGQGNVPQTDFGVLAAAYGGQPSAYTRPQWDGGSGDYFGRVQRDFDAGRVPIPARHNAGHDVAGTRQKIRGILGG